MSERRVKTSRTHPLRIDTVPSPLGGSIGLTLCPGKQQSESTTGPWARDLGPDLDVIEQAGAAALVTLMPTEELDWIRVPPLELGRAARARGMEWFHLPIEDVTVPDETFERDWRYAGPRLRRHLECGRTVVLHCRAGLGRTGTIAARLLVESGRKPDRAIDDVRAARPGTIETAEQEDHVRYSKPADPRADRIAGCLLGGAVGDALGSPVEFLSLAEILERYGPEGIADFPDRGERTGQVTDDTQMTLFTAEGLLLGAADGDRSVPALTRSVWRAYLRWLETQGFGRPEDRRGRLLGIEALHEPRAPGMTCLSALRSGRMGAPEAPLNNSKGCGGVMRVAPAGLFAAALDDVAAVFHLGTATAAITHGHPSGHLPAGTMAATVALLLDGANLGTALGEASDLLATHPGHEETLAALATARALTDPDAEALESLGEAWVGDEALAIAVAAARAPGDFERTVRLAVNHGGDSDSTGAIAGNLAGARLGAGAIPAFFAQRVEFRDLLLDFAGDFAAVSGR
jgi:ADP-ribosylglycohydrolase/protein-tyrosine phosphatase